MLKMYSKPILTRVEMRPSEATLGVCKKVEVVSAAWMGSGLQCATGPLSSDACREVSGS